MAPRSRNIAASVAVVAALLVFGGLTVAAAASADDADGNTGGVGLSVTVGSTEGPSHSGTPTSEPSVPPVDPTPSASPSASPRPDEVDLGGIVYISGLTSTYVWSANPTQSSVILRFTVHNISKTTFNSSARFWLTTSFGSTVSEVDGVAIHALKPDESRVVTATVSGLGQWTVLHAHATFTPPAVVEGIKLVPVTRDSFVFVPPVLVGGIGAIGAVLGVCGFLVLKFGWLTRLFGLAKAAV